MSFCNTLKRYFKALWPCGNKNVKPPTTRKDTSVQEEFSIISGSSSKLPPCLEVDNGTGATNLPSSVITVLSNDDLLIEILLRLPVISLHLFKSVSKHWLSLITSPNFTLPLSKISRIEPSLGLLKLRDDPGFCLRKTFEYDFVSFDIRIPSKRSTVFTLGSEAPPGSVEITQSCNGLFLCRIIQYNSYAYKYNVYNPTTKLFKMLPIESRMLGVRIAFDSTKSLHYKVIHVNVIYDDGHYIQIETYSSESGKLSVYTDVFDVSYFSFFKDGIYWNDAILWLESNYLQSLICKLEIVNEHPVLTVQHFLTFDGELPYQSKLFESRGSLLLLCIDKFNSRHLTIFEMRNGYSEWSVKYTVNLDDLLMPHSNSWIKHCVWSIVLREREEDSFMIIDLISKVVRYNPVLKTVCTLSDLRSSVFYTFRKFYVRQFRASSAGV